MALVSLCLAQLSGRKQLAGWRESTLRISAWWRGSDVWISGIEECQENCNLSKYNFPLIKYLSPQQEKCFDEKSQKRKSEKKARPRNEFYELDGRRRKSIIV